MNITLLAACLCLSLPCWAQDREESPAEIAYNQAYDKWMLGLTHFLTEQESPIVRVLGSWQLDALNREHPALVGEGRKIRALALEDGWSDPAVILGVFGKDCRRGRPGDNCDPSRVQSQLLKIDPDNAVAVLLPWLFPLESPAEAIDFNTESVATLVEAAGKDKFDLYLTAGFYDAYQEIAHYSSLHKQPEIPEKLLAVFDEQGFRPPEDPTWAPSLSVLATAFASTGLAAFQNLFNFCGLAESEKHADAMRACLDLADLMQSHSKSILEEMMGHGVRKRIERPGYHGANKELQDPERWRDRVRALEFDCARPRIIGSFLSYEQMPADHWSQYVRELQESGERVASQRAADREYAEFPELYEMDPADCSRIHELDEETQQRLAREYEIKQLGEVLQALDNGTVIDLTD